jgi:acyl-CoA synthetase (NDP forming)
MDVHNLGGGFNGVACPLNPSQESALGTQCYPDVARVPNTPDPAITCSFRRP